MIMTIGQTKYDIDRNLASIRNILSSIGLSGFENVPLLLDLFSAFIAQSQTTINYGSVIGRSVTNSSYPHEVQYRDWETDRKSTRLNSSH